MEKYNLAITTLQQRLMSLENAYEKYVENGNCNKNSAVAKQNRNNCIDLQNAIKTLQASTDKSKLLLADVITCSECGKPFKKKEITIIGDIDTCDDCLCPN